jgi:hypothetical protein
MVSDLPVAVPVRTGSSTRTAPSSPATWANPDGGSGLDLADHGEHELKGVPRGLATLAVKG